MAAINDAALPSPVPASSSWLDNKWMTRTLVLARKGEAQTHPNPMVGAIVVAGDRAVGQGCHIYDRMKHAEVLALEEAGERARGATLYTNLEPCSITGRTGPCAQAIIAAGIKRVVAAMKDPNPRVSGRGFRMLRKAGIEVVTGVLEAEARRLNEAFACWIRTGRPMVTLKVAMTLDGRVAPAGASEQHRVASARGRRATAHDRWITSEVARDEVQRMRHAADAIVTGIGTVLADDPLLTDRTGKPRRKPLVRVVLDSRLRLPIRSKLARSADGDVLAVTRMSENSARAWRLEYAGVETLRLPGRGGELPLKEVIQALGELEMVSVLIEAGPRLVSSALRSGVVDKVVLFYAPRFLGGDALPVIPPSASSSSRGGAKRPKGRAGARARFPTLNEVTLSRFGPDFAVEGYLRDVYRDH